jgi:hypothetical protein
MSRVTSHAVDHGLQPARHAYKANRFLTTF